MAVTEMQRRNGKRGIGTAARARIVRVGLAVLVFFYATDALFMNGVAVAAGIETAAANKGSEKVRADLTAFLKNGAVGQDVSVEIPPVSTFKFNREKFPGEIRTEFSTRRVPPYRGRIAVTVSLFAGDRLVRRAIVSPYVLLSEEVVVASRDLRRGEVLAPKDLEVAKRDQARLGRGVFASVDDLLGLRLKRSVRQGGVILEAATEEVPIVERGDRVVVVLESGAMKLQSIGFAKETGIIGQWIRVQNMESKRELSGRLDGAGRVHVAF